MNAERFITPELKEMEGKVLGAQDKANRLEYELFDGVRSEVAKELSRLQRAARILAELDVFSGMATVADRGRFVAARSGRLQGTDHHGRPPSRFGPPAFLRPVRAQ